MGTIRVARGSGASATATASYDAALADAGLHNYNLVSVSSVVPPSATVEVVETAPDLGPIGGRLTVVEARATVAAEGSAAAVLGWSRTADGPGLFYEASAVDDLDGDPAGAAADRVREGLSAGLSMRGWSADEPTLGVEATTATDEGYATAVVVAAFGRAEPIC